ncbi:MAG: GntR family transcriptional regulator [Comamonadaceae bacterium]|nr:MAG: GntR family transcriptional regulator [Comamonadaceae bacterium]
MSGAVEAENGAAAPACLPAGPAAPPRGFRLPPGAWDTHAHVIGGDAAHPFVAGRSYTPPPVGAEDYVAMLDTVGLAHGVLIQISVHGTDNRLIVDALRRHPTRLRGVVSIDGDESDAELGELKAAGVCGVRLNELYAGGSGTERLRRIAERCRELGWHLDLALHGPRLNALAPVLRTLGLPLVIDHMGWCATADGVAHPDFQAVLSLVGDADCWVKLSGVYRLSALAPPYPDAAPLVRALLEAAPRRCIWGSDWPHVALNDPARMPQPGDLLDALAGHVGDDPLLQAVLVDNPLRLFGQPGTPVNG